MGENYPSRSYLGKPYLGTNHSFFSRSCDRTRFIEQAFKTGECLLRYLDKFWISEGFVRDIRTVRFLRPRLRFRLDRDLCL